MSIFHYWKKSLGMLTSNAQYGFWSELGNVFTKTVYTLIVRCWWLMLLFLILSVIPVVGFLFALLFAIVFATYIIVATKSNINFNSKRDFRTVFWSIIKVGALFIMGSILLLIVSLLRLKVNWLDIYSLDRKVISQMIMQYHINNISTIGRALMFLEQFIQVWRKLSTLFLIDFCLTREYCAGFVGVGRSLIKGFKYILLYLPIFALVMLFRLDFWIVIIALYNCCKRLHQPAELFEPHH